MILVNVNDRMTRVRSYEQVRPEEDAGKSFSGLGFGNDRGGERGTTKSRENNCEVDHVRRATSKCRVC